VLLEKDFKFESVAIVVENNDFASRPHRTGRADAEGRQEGRFSTSTQDRNDTNWYATITRIPASRPDLVIVSISAVQAANSSSTYAEAGITTPRSGLSAPPRIFGVRWVRRPARSAGARGLLREERNQHAGPEGIRREARSARAEELNEAHDVTYWDVASYDAVRLVADAIKRGGPQRDT